MVTRFDQKWLPLMWKHLNYFGKYDDSHFDQSIFCFKMGGSTTNTDLTLSIGWIQNKACSDPLLEM